MFDWTYELGFAGLIIRMLPALMLLTFGGLMHFAASKQLEPRATSTPFMALFAESGELSEKGESARMWSLGFYVSGVIAAFLIAVLGGVPEPEPEAGPVKHRKSDGPPPFIQKQQAQPQP